MEADGISKFWKMKAWAKITKTSSVQMEARDSSGLSVRDCFSIMGGGDTLSVTMFVICFLVWLTASLLKVFPSPDPIRLFACQQYSERVFENGQRQRIGGALDYYELPVMS